MIPMWMLIKVPRREGKGVRLFLPFFIVWILLLTLLVLLSPIWLIATLIARAMGYGWIGFVILALLVNTFWHLQGLIVDVESENEKIYLEFN